MARFAVLGAVLGAVFSCVVLALPTPAGAATAARSFGPGDPLLELPECTGDGGTDVYDPRLKVRQCNWVPPPCDDYRYFRYERDPRRDTGECSPTGDPRPVCVDIDSGGWAPDNDRDPRRANGTCQEWPIPTPPPPAYHNVSLGGLGDLQVGVSYSCYEARFVELCRRYPALRPSFRITQIWSTGPDEHYGNLESIYDGDLVSAPTEHASASVG
jgi:hypothetical protein